MPLIVMNWDNLRRIRNPYQFKLMIDDASFAIWYDAIHIWWTGQSLIKPLKPPPSLLTIFCTFFISFLNAIPYFKSHNEFVLHSYSLILKLQTPECVWNIIWCGDSCLFWWWNQSQLNRGMPWTFLSNCKWNHTSEQTRMMSWGGTGLGSKPYNTVGGCLREPMSSSPTHPWLKPPWGFHSRNKDKSVRHTHQPLCDFTSIIIAA